MMMVGPVGASTENLQGLGLFKRAYYDPEDGKFLGCVDYSKSWLELTNDTPFKVGRIVGTTMALFATIASIICLTIQCFSKHGKTRFWGVMRWTYLLAFLSQGGTSYLFFADICENFDGKDSTCVIGSNGIAAISNAVFLFGMVVASCCSLPPRNPVFRLWYSNPDYDTDNADSYDEDDSGDDIEKGSKKNDDNDSVSLFGGSVKSSRSRKSNKGNFSSQNSVVSKAPKGLHAINEDKEVSDPPMKADDESVANSLVESIKSQNEKSRSGAVSVTKSMASFQRHAVDHFEHDVVLGPGGVRKGETREGNLIIIEDEYPATTMNGEIIDGSDMIKVRSEYCKLGRKTIREEYQQDGSRTVKTTITILRDDSVIAAIDP